MSGLAELETNETSLEPSLSSIAKARQENKVDDWMKPKKGISTDLNR
jgi:hypothetical protein